MTKPAYCDEHGWRRTDEVDERGNCLACYEGRANRLAEVYTKVTGAVGATVRYEHRDPVTGKIVVDAEGKAGTEVLNAAADANPNRGGDMTKQRVAVRKADADKVLAAVRRQFAGWLEPGHPEYGPQLMQDFDWGAGVAPYAVVWEGGPYEWTFLAGEGGIEEEFGTRVKAVEFPEAVFVEPYTGWALGIYPA